MPTTLQVSRETKKRLEEEKNHPRETYGEVIKMLLEEKEQRLKEKIERAKKQKSIPHEKAKKILGLE